MKLQGIIFKHYQVFDANDAPLWHIFKVNYMHIIKVMKCVAHRGDNRH